MKEAGLPFVFAVLVSVSGPGAGKTFAQYGYSPSCIEWLTASSDVVVRATVAELAFKDRAPMPGEAESQWQWVTVTLKVQSSLKGKPPQTIVFVVEQLRGSETLLNWRKTTQANLWFLVDLGDKKVNLPPDFPAQAQGKLYLRDAGAKITNSSVLELGTPKTGKRLPSPVFSMDFTVLDEEHKVLEAVKTEVERQHKGEPRAIGIMMPREVAQRSGRAGDANSLTVPVNGRLEQLARLWVRSKEDWLRAGGVKALGEFKSEANVAILKSMLADIAWWGEEKERVYFIRESAYKTLREWNIAVDKPTLREPRKDR
jgi:hypothetical protein